MKMASLDVPNWPLAGLTSWHSTQLAGTGTNVSAFPPKKKSCPICCADVSESSRLRTGFGCGRTCNWKSVNCCISSGDGKLPAPSKSWKATMKLLKDKLDSNGSIRKILLEQSPRQCMAPEFLSPRKVCVVIGPFMD